MTNKILIILSVIAVVLVGIGLFRNSDKSPTAKINDHNFKIEVAKTVKEKEIGLSKYKNIKEENGMIFPFEKADYYSFWMKQMKFSIDIIFIRDGKIVTIYKNASPPKSENQTLLLYKPKEPSNMVLEINAGLSDKYNLRTGDKIILNDI